MKPYYIFIYSFILVLTSSLFAQMTVEDMDSNVLVEISDEGTVGSITLPDTSVAPSNLVNKLYNLNGILNWNGTPLGSSTPLEGWSLAGNNMYSNVTGNVGIGTSSPQFNLHLRQRSQYAVTMGVEWNDNDINEDASAWFYYAVGGGTVDLHGGTNMIRNSGSALQFSTRNAKTSGTITEQMRLSSDGHLGIGTNNPQKKLHIFNVTSGFNNPVAIFESETNTRLDIRGPGTDKSLSLQFSDPFDSWKGGFGLNEATNDLEIFTNANGNKPRMVIKDNGNVGIGTTDPEAQLDVNGDLQVTGAYTGNIGPNNGAPFPRPAYDSGWLDIAPAESKTLTHGIGGDVDNYLVDMMFYQNGVGRHQTRYGGDYSSDWGVLGASWRNLTSSQIEIGRGIDDGWVDQIRVRIWVYN